MKRTLVLLLSVMVVSVFVLAGCSSQAQKAECGFDEGSAEVEGKTLTIALDGDPDAGFDWVFTQTGDSLLLKETSYTAHTADNSTTSDSADEGSIDKDMNVGGATSTYGGVYTFVIEGTTAGDETITLKYVLDKASSASITYTFEVSTKGDGTIKSVTARKNGEMVGGVFIS